MTETVTIRREYPVPPERVFRAWTEIELLRQWFGSGPGMLWTVHQWEPTAGGALHVSLTFDSGPFEVKGEFLEVEPPHRLRYRWGDDQFVDVRISARGNGSAVEITHSGIPTEHRGFVDTGWSTAVEQLAELWPAPTSA
jgi:uncharacterized protein YndB with AHSA1/START domain